MRTTQEFIEFAKKGHPNCPPNCYYIGPGMYKNPLHDYFGMGNIICKSNMGGYNRQGVEGYDSGIDYFCPKEIWHFHIPDISPEMISGEDKPVTLQQIQKEMADAQKLIGKNIQFKSGINWEDFRVASVELFVTGELPRLLQSNSVKSAYEKNGWVIILRDNGTGALSNRHEIKIPKPEITIHSSNGNNYKAEQHDDYWRFGCASIKKTVIEASLKFMKEFPAASDGFKIPQTIQIGKGYFSKEQLEQLVEQGKDN